MRRTDEVITLQQFPHGASAASIALKKNCLNLQSGGRVPRGLGILLPAASKRTIQMLSIGDKGSVVKILLVGREEAWMRARGERNRASSWQAPGATCGWPPPVRIRIRILV